MLIKSHDWGCWGKPTPDCIFIEKNTLLALVIDKAIQETKSEGNWKTLSCYQWMLNIQYASVSCMLW